MNNKRAKNVVSWQSELRADARYVNQGKQKHQQLFGERQTTYALIYGGMERQGIQIFEDKQVRTIWDEEHEKWYFSIVDVAGILSGSKAPASYWRKLKQRLKEEGNQSVTNCHALKLQHTFQTSSND